MVQTLGLPRLGGSPLNKKNILQSTPAITGQISQMRTNVLPQMALQTPQVPQVDTKHSFNAGPSLPRELPKTGATPQVDPKLQKIVDYVKTTYPDLSPEEKVGKIKELRTKYEGMKTEQNNTEVPLQGGVRRGATSFNSLEGTMLEGLEPANKVANTLNPIGLLTEFIDNNVQKIPTISRESMAKALKGTPFEGMEVLPTMVANAPGSLLKTASATARGITNPFDTIVGLGRLALTKEGNQLIVDRYGSIEGLKKTMTEDPVGLASDALTIVQGGANLTSAGAKLGGATSLATKAGNVGKIAGGAADLGLSTVIPNGVQKLQGLGQELGQKGVLGAGVKNVIEGTVGGMQPIETVKAGIKGAKLMIDEGVDLAQNTKLGLTKEEVQGIQNNPYQSEYRNETKQVLEQQGVPQELNSLTLAPNEALKNLIQENISSYEKVHSDSGPLYDEIRKGKGNVDFSTAKTDILSELNSKYQVKVKGKPTKQQLKAHPKGVLDFDGTMFEGNTTVQNQIQNAFDVATSSKELDPTGFLNKRRAIDAQVKWEGKNTLGTPVVKAIRGKVDAIGKEQIPGLKETDKLRSKQLKELNEMKSKLVYEAGPKKGEFRDNITQIVKTLGKENRHQVLKRLEEIIPGLKERVEAIQNIPKLAKAYTNLGKASKLAEGAGAVVGSTVGSKVGGIPGSIIGGIIGWGIAKYLEGKMGTIRKEALDGVLSEMSPQAKSTLVEINRKLESKQEISQSDRNMIESIKRKIEQSSEPQEQ